MEKIIITLRRGIILVPIARTREKKKKVGPLYYSLEVSNGIKRIKKKIHSNPYIQGGDKII